MLLWLSCVKMRDSPGIDPGERATFAMQVWMEADCIEKQLARHACKNEECDDWVGRHFLSEYARLFVWHSSVWLILYS